VPLRTLLLFHSTHRPLAAFKENKRKAIVSASTTDSVRSQLSNELCTCACSSVQELAPNSVPVPLQTLVHALHDSQRSVRISVFHLERSSLPLAMLRYRLSNADTDRRTRIHSRITNYRTLGENPTYSNTHSLPVYNYSTVTLLIYVATYSPLYAAIINVHSKKKSNNKPNSIGRTEK
jgi:hypothetical protein